MDLSNNNIARTTNKRLRMIRRLPKIDEFFERISNLNCDWGIVGGFIRDALFDFDANDVDVIVDCPPEKLEETYAGLYKARKKNVFGGWAFNIQGVQFDLWTVKESWPFVDGLVRYDGIGSFVECVQLNVDAILVCPDTSRIYERGFRDCLQTGKLSFHFTDHPYPRWLAKKALRKAERYNLFLTPEAKSFVREHYK